MSRSVGVLALTGGRLVGGVFGLVTAMVLTRLLSKNDYGLYQQVWLIYNTALPFLMMGLPSGVTYFVPQVDRSAQKTILVQIALLLALAGVVLAAGTCVLADNLENYFGEGLAPLLRSFFWFPVLSLPLLVMDVFLIATHRASTSAIIAVISSVTQFASVAVPVALGYRLIVAIQLLCATALLKLIVFTPIVMHGYWGVRYTWDFGFIRKILAYTLPLGVASIFGTLALQTGKILVAFKFSPEDFAIYDIAVRELPFIGIITGSVMAVVTPDFVRLHFDRDFREILRLLHSATVKTAIFLLPLFVFLLIFARDVVVVLFSEKYESSSSIFSIHLLFVPLRVVQGSALLMAAGKTRMILWLHVGAVPIAFLLCIFLIPILGMVGAALGTVLTVYIVAGCLLFGCSRVIAGSMSSILPWATLGRIALMSLIAGLIAYISTMALSQGVMRLGVGCLVFGAVAAGSGWLMKDVRVEIEYIMKSILKTRLGK